VRIHETAALGFGRGAADYEHGRPGYAPEAIVWLVEQLALGPGARAVDLAAGTGKLTRALLPSGAHVIAVEPVAAMRAALVEGSPGAEVLEGTAEAMPLASESVDAVAVAQAFHWFHGERALSEIHRVLRPGGRLALVWNVRNLEQPLQRALEDLLEPHRGSTPSHRSTGWKDAFASTTLFEPHGSHRTGHLQRLDAEGLVARVASISFIAALPARDRDQVLGEVRGLAEAEGGEADLEYETEVVTYDRSLARP
jgi:SAM-dependent methyltransferase